MKGKRRGILEGKIGKERREGRRELKKIEEYSI
jgi:hypothetical protein